MTRNQLTKREQDLTAQNNAKLARIKEWEQFNQQLQLLEQQRSNRSNEEIRRLQNDVSLQTLLASIEQNKRQNALNSATLQENIRRNKASEFNTRQSNRVSAASVVETNRANRNRESISRESNKIQALSGLGRIFGSLFGPVSKIIGGN